MKEEETDVAALLLEGVIGLPQPEEIAAPILLKRGQVVDHGISKGNPADRESLRITRRDQSFIQAFPAHRNTCCPFNRAQCEAVLPSFASVHKRPP
jgi:hypothetical protein